MSGAGSAVFTFAEGENEGSKPVPGCGTQTPDITAAIAACVRDGSRMAKTAKRAWFTTARPAT